MSSKSSSSTESELRLNGEVDASSDTMSLNRSLDVGSSVSNDDEIDEVEDEGFEEVSKLDVNGYSTDEDLRFPREERREYLLDDCKVVRMGYKRNKENVAYGVVFRCRGQELVFPYVDEREENLLDRYISPIHQEVVDCPDILLFVEREKELGEAQYLTTYSKFSIEKEEM